MAEMCSENELPQNVCRLREEHKKVVSGCEGQIQHWKKLAADYESLQARLQTLPDRLSYDVMVPFGPLAFMPGKLVHTNEIMVLLGDNWFARCSTKQAIEVVEHRKKHVKNTLEDLEKVTKNFEDRLGFTEDADVLGGKGDYVDIREELDNEKIPIKGKRRVAHQPNAKPKVEAVLQLEEAADGGRQRGILSEEELWARLDELEAQEELMDEQDRVLEGPDGNGEDTTSSSSEEEKDAGGGRLSNGLHLRETWPASSPGCPGNGSAAHGEEEAVCVPTIYFSHTVEPKKVRINTGKNTTLKYSERKEEAKRKRRNSGGSNGHSLPERPRIRTPADVYRVFVDVVNGELVPRKSILKSRSRENSVCSDTSESSAADMDERRGPLRSTSHEDAAQSDASEGSPEEGVVPGRALPTPGPSEAFSGTVVEKDPGLQPSIPHLTITPPGLPTIPERKSEELAPEGPPGPPQAGVQVQGGTPAAEVTGAPQPTSPSRGSGLPI
ncbi:unconventional prefoldin RPB5 interactor 1 isoform X2 [Brienomyrus brachyistius]|uniref:unconventional prefoldin RPB5 interactor 1 isoform X2 n=1 Tax=Brienomyrus brachyistius TaxID=42636 RepID=UPI0020B296F4|nr:unconventional prefoldin RPB5 interactor 1 isoform X2 [Brienomyrus brachyistius]